MHMGHLVSRQRPWTDKEVKMMRRFYSSMETDELACELQRSYGSVRKKAARMGLVKSRRYLKSIGR
jgi:hypothetical protein